MKQTDTAPPPATSDIATASNIQALMRLLENPQPEAYSCEQTFILLDEYVEALMQSKLDTKAAMHLVKHHLDNCPDCHEQFAALLRILETEKGT